MAFPGKANFFPFRILFLLSGTEKNLKRKKWPYPKGHNLGLNRKGFTWGGVGGGVVPTGNRHVRVYLNFMSLGEKEKNF